MIILPARQQKNFRVGELEAFIFRVKRNRKLKRISRKEDGEGHMMKRAPDERYRRQGHYVSESFMEF